jgi:hypothetical protein
MLRKLICLNGEWQFQPDSGALQFPPSSATWSKTKIRIPSPWNVNSFFPEKGGDFRCYPSYPKEWETTSAGWHRREFIVPHQWKNSQIVLHFEGVHYYCEIYINGKLVGKHEDGFIPFEFDISDYIIFGQTNELLVGVKSFLFFNRQSPLNAKTKYPYPTGSFWGMLVSGIWLDVILMVFPKVRIEDVYIQTSVRKKQIVLTTTIINNTNKAQNIYLIHNIKKWKHFNSSVDIESHTKKTVTVSHPWTTPQLWHPEHPYLYYLETKLETDNGIRDKLTTRFGFREFWIKKTQFILNGTPIKLRGDAWHYLGIAYQNPAYARLWYQLAKQSNINHIRLHAQVYPQYYLDLADELGILITDETAIWASHCAYHYNADFWRRAKDHVSALVKRDRNHPSVVIWSVENEALAAYTFVQDDAVKSNDNLSARFYELVKEMKKIDATRPISADGSFDLCSRAEIYNIHYPPLPRLKDNIKNKPITVGEFGSMYYSTSDEVSPLHGESTYLSFSERLNAIAKEQERMIYLVREWAEQVSPFNIIWYSMDPLPFSGKPIKYSQLDTPGPKPERIGPYTATLNPGYDNHLPKWKPNALYPELKKMLLPIRFFVQERDKSCFANSKIRQTVTIHNDSYHFRKLTLCWSVRTEKDKLIAHGNKIFELQPAKKQHYRFEFSTPKVVQRTSLKLNIQLKIKWKIVYQETRSISCLPQLPVLQIPGKPEYQNQTYLIPPKAKLTLKQIEQLKSQVRAGLRVICLDNNDHFLNALGYTAVESGKYDRAFIQSPTHPILKNIDKSDLHFWGEDELVTHANLVNFPKGNFRPLINLGNGTPILIELIDGNGAYYLTTLALSNNIRTEPGAELVYRNLLDYANQPLRQRFSETILFGESSKNLNVFLAYLGVEYHKSTTSESIESQTIIIDGSRDFDNKQSKYISAFLHKGGTVLIFGLVPDTLNSFASILPYPIELAQRDIEHLVKTKPDRLLSGIHSGDLYWIERDQKNPIIRYSIETTQKKNRDILLGVSSLDWRKWNWEAEPIKTAAILKSELAKKESANGLVRFRIGNGQIIINQLCYKQTNLAKSGKVTSLLLTNLGIRLNPEKAKQFADFVQRDPKNKQKLDLLLNPSG